MQIEDAPGRRFYATDPELRRLFKSVNGLIFPGGLTDLYIDDPYVIAAKKLHKWAVEANDAGEVCNTWYCSMVTRKIRIADMRLLAYVPSYKLPYARSQP